VIYNVRGTSGSGKTTLCRQFVKAFGERAVEIRADEKLFGYKLPERFRVLGRYDDGVRGGGVDNITGALMKRFVAAGGVGNSMDAVEAQVRRWADAGYHVLFEGLIVTGVWSRWERLAAELPVHFLFLDTPLDVCYARVQERNGGKPIKGWPGGSDLEAKHASTGRQQASIEKTAAAAGRQLAKVRSQSTLEDFHHRTSARQIPKASAGGLRYTLLDHTRALAQLREIVAAETGLRA
jgi:hypothetical protein